jgi:hypothetical protein
MWWNIGALGHVADVAQITLVNDRLVIGFGYLLDFTVFGGVDQIKEGREGAAQAQATTAAVA